MKFFIPILFLFANALSANENKCPYPVLKNIELRVKLQKHLFESAYNRCKVKIPNLPCLLKFEKVAEDDYVAIFGKEISKINKKHL